MTTGSINAVINFFSSTDGRTWSSTRTGITQTNNGSVGNAVAYNGSIWVIGGSTGSSSILYTSSNGTAWGINPTTLNQTNCYGLAWNGTYWLILGGATTAINTIIKANATLTSFTSSATGGASGFATQANAAAWNGSMWVAVGADGANANPNMKYSYDGTNWTNAATGRIAGGGNAVIWNGYMWVAGGIAGGSFVLWYSYNGINWTASPNGTTLMTSSCQSIAWNGTVFVAAGYSGGAGRLIYSYDGITWTAVSGYVLSVSVFSVVWNGKLFVAAGSGTVGTTSSPDGITWTSQVNGPGSSDNMYAVGFSSNVTPDAVIGTVAFQSKQPQFLFSTPTINAGSNWLTLNGSMKVTPTSVSINGTFNVGSQINFPNGSVIYASNSTGTLESCFFPRWLDNCTYLDYGAGGFYIRSAGDGTNYAVFMAPNRNIGIRNANPQCPLDVAGTVRAYGGEIVCSNGDPAFGQIRMVSGNYGAFWRNDGGNFYLLFTDSGDQYGGWNDLRPFQVNLVSGNVYMKHSLSVDDPVTIYATGSTSTANDQFGLTGANDSFNIYANTSAYNGGVASIFFGLRDSTNYPLARIYAKDEQTVNGDAFLGGLYFQTGYGTALATAMRIDPYQSVVINKRLFVYQAIYSALFSVAEDTNDRINNAPSYGMGTANYGILGIGGINYHLQIAHYYGISFTAGNSSWATANPTCVMGNNKVGINTKTPTYALDVGGSAPASNLAISGTGIYNANTQSSASLNVTRSVGGFISYTVSFYYNNGGGTNQYQTNNIHTFIPRATYAIMYAANVQNAAGTTTINYGHYHIQIYGGRNVDSTGGSDVGYSGNLGIPNFQTGSYAYYNNQAQGAAGYVRCGITILNFFLPNTSINNGNAVQTVT